MCEQCVINPLYFGQVFPGYTLIRARRESAETKVGQYGLVQCNDPTFTITFNFHLIPDTKEWDEQVAQLWKQLDCHPVIGFELITACITKGYSVADSGPFVDWFALAIREHLVTHEAEVDEDPFPKLDQIMAIDYSEWVAPTPFTNEGTE